MVCNRCEKYLGHPKVIICHECALKYSECLICQACIPNQQGKKTPILLCKQCGDKATEKFLNEPDE